DGPGAVLLEVPDGERPLTLLGCRPAARLTVRADGGVERDDGRPPARDPLAAIAEFVAEGARGAAALPFPFGATVVGFLAYELGRMIEPVAGPAGPPLDLPLAVLVRYDTLLAYDRTRAQFLILSTR